jgi:hypothetical protein
MEAIILNSWKEIAQYVGRGVRTVERWERKLGLPVHRPQGHLRSPVIAISTEIDEWLGNGRPKQEQLNGLVTSKLDVWATATPLGNADLIGTLQAEVAHLKRENKSLRRQLSEMTREPCKPAAAQQIQNQGIVVREI